MKYLFGLIISLLASDYSFSNLSVNKIEISGKFIGNTKFTHILVRQYGVGSRIVESIPIDKDSGTFKILIPATTPPGIYRFEYSQVIENAFFDVILNGIDTLIEVKITLVDERNIVSFLTPGENRIWQDFKNRLDFLQEQISLIDYLLHHYPESNSKFYASVRKERKELIKTIHNEMNFWLKRNSSVWLRYLACYYKPNFADPTIHERLQMSDLHDHFWDNKPTDDTLIINTPIYTNAILRYIKYYMGEGVDFTDREKAQGLRRCIDTILFRFSKNPKTQEFAIRYLQLGFNEIGNEAMLQYIDTQYADKSQCLFGNDSSFVLRMNTYANLAKGSSAPQKEWITDRLVQLGINRTSQKQILLVFWASWCPHCMVELPKLKQFSATHPETLVLAVSLDEDRIAYEKVIQDFPEFVHLCDFKKWEGELAKSYFIKGTPTFFLIDENWKIISKAINLDSL